MAKGYTTRKLEVWAMHAHIGQQVPDYTKLFRDVARAPSRSRAVPLGEKLVAIPRVSVKENVMRFIAYEGVVGENPLIFSAADAAERIERLEAGEVVATKTHAMLDTELRLAVVEYNHRGAKAPDIASVIETSARRLSRWERLDFELNPVVDTEFVDAIDRFDRIRVATMRIARPNLDWTDFKNKLTDSAADSDAQSIEIDYFAGRGNSLDRSKGAIGFLKRLIRREGSILKNASVTGTRANESAETTVSLGNHITHQRVNVRMTEDGHVADEDINERIGSFLDALREERGN